MGKQEPLMSVVMPVFNAEKFLSIAMDSILAQSYRDFEFLVLDDGSTDGSLAILKKYAAADPRVRLFARENRGVGYSAKQLAELAQGRYLARMDGDDVALPDRLSKQVAFLEENPDCVVVGSGIELINEYGQRISPLLLPANHAEIDRFNLAGHSSISHPAAMIRRSALMKVMGYDEKMESAEDLDLWLRLAEVGRLANLQEVLLQYRLYGGSLSEQKRELQGRLSRQACERAWARRGIEGRYDPEADDWRPGKEIGSQHKYALRYGWMAWSNHNSDAWWTYVRRALALRPFAISSWKLLILGWLRSPH